MKANLKDVLLCFFLLNYLLVFFFSDLRLKEVVQNQLKIWHDSSRSTSETLYSVDVFSDVFQSLYKTNKRKIAKKKSFEVVVKHEVPTSHFLKQIWQWTILVTKNHDIIGGTVFFDMSFLCLNMEFELLNFSRV